MKVGYETVLLSQQDTGVGVAIRELLLALSAIRPNDEFITFGARCRDGVVPATSNIRICRASIPPLGRTGRIMWQQGILPLTLGRSDCDVYHAPGYVASPRLPKPYVVTVYDTLALEQPHLTTRRNAAYYRWALPRALRAASRVIVPSNHVRDRVLSINQVPRNKIAVIPLGVSSRFRHLSSGDIEQRLALLSGLIPGEYFLFVGNIERKKNLPMLIRAFARWSRASRSGIRLVLVGKGGNAFREVMAQIYGEGMGSEVLVLGYVADSELVDLYNGAVAVLYPSLNEGFGLPPLEAAACGTAAIVSDSGALPETAGDFATVVPAHDVDAWADAIDRATISSKASSDKTEVGLRHTAQLTWRNCAAKVFRIYEESVAEETIALHDFREPRREVL